MSKPTKNRCPNDRYVVVRTIKGYTWATNPQDKRQATQVFRWVIGAREAWMPHTGNRARLMAEADWDRINKKAGAPLLVADPRATERDLLARVSRWAHANGWAPGPYPGQWRNADTEVIWSAGTGEVGVARKHHHTWMAHDWYPASTVSAVVAVLVTEGVLPPTFHMAYARAYLAGVAA